MLKLSDRFYWWLSVASIVISILNIMMVHYRCEQIKARTAEMRSTLESMKQR